MKKLVLFSALFAMLIGCNSNSETKRTEDTTINKMDHTVIDTANPSINMDPTSTALNDVDREFVMKAAMGNKVEIEAGQIASAKANAANVKEFANMLVKDHSDVLTRLKGLATTLSVHAPDSISKIHQALKTKLEKLSGAAFDKEYIAAMVVAHQETVALLEKEINTGSNSQLKQFASTVLPTVKMHLEKAQALRGSSK